MADKERIEMLESPRKEIVEYLEEQGLKVFVAGEHGVKGRGESGKMEYVFKFTAREKG